MTEVNQPPSSGPQRWAIGVSVVAGLAAALWHWTAAESRPPEPGLTVFDRWGSGLAITVRAGAAAEERRAARMLRHAFAVAGGRPEAKFPIVPHGEGFMRPRAIEVRALGPRPREGDALVEKAAIEVNSGRAVLTALTTDAVEAAAGWFLEEAMGARWFMPGRLGESIPRRAELRLEPGRREHTPSYLSRHLGLGGGAADTDWWRRNRLRSVLQHGHAMAELFPPAMLRRHPELAPIVNGRRELPALRGGRGWQPDLTAPGAVAQAVSALSTRPAFSSAFGMNDSVRYDQSAATLARVAPPRWFRGRPDYSDLVFGFTNEVARRVPHRYLGAYAYDWTENTPAFPIEPNVVPWLTADRSQWFDPVFAAEDQALIRRWASMGGEFTAIYDYYYGAPFFVPRPTLYAVAQSIPFAHAAGVRAFYAETFPNWGLDGPKPWLAAQLLWNAGRDPAALLDTYYREFWAEAAEPMRRFFAICDRQWLNQPLPSYWIKYYKDEHQHLLFPASVRRELEAQLAAASSAAATAPVRARVAFVQAAFAVADAFCRMCETRDELARLLLDDGSPVERIATLARQFTQDREELDDRRAAARRDHPGAIRAELLPEYTRNDPRRKALLHLVRRGEAETAALAPTARQLGLDAVARLARSGREVLADREWRECSLEFTNASTDLEWVRFKGGWWGHGRPFETRRIAFTAGAGRDRAIRFAGCLEDTLERSMPGGPGELHVATAQVRAKVSPGNMTFVILNFIDATGKPLGFGRIDRLPVGDWSHGVQLATWEVAPAGTRRVGIALRVLNQVNDDFAEFAQVSLRRVDR